MSAPTLEQIAKIAYDGYEARNPDTGARPGGWWVSWEHLGDATKARWLEVTAAVLRAGGEQRHHDDADLDPSWQVECGTCDGKGWYHR